MTHMGTAVVEVLIEALDEERAAELIARTGEEWSRLRERALGAAPDFAGF